MSESEDRATACMGAIKAFLERHKCRIDVKQTLINGVHVSHEFIIQPIIEQAVPSETTQTKEVLAKSSIGEADRLA